MIDAIAERIWRRCKIKSGTACWVYSGRPDSRGYGQISFASRNYLCHRIAYMQVNGEIPSGKGRTDSVVMHTCDNKLCCNPAHLRFGTHAANMADMKAKGRRKKIGSGAENGRAKLTPEQVASIRADRRGQRKIAADFSISPAQVQRIRRGLQWVTHTATS